MLELKELKDLHQKAYDYNTITREKASDDLVFAWVTQWDDNLLGESQLQYRGEFNIIRRATRQIISDLRANPVQVDYEPLGAATSDDADLLDGIYRTDDKENTSIEAFDNASSESVNCGIGAWELYTEYETNAEGDDNQVIRRRPLYEANNNTFWDPSAKLLDKSDSDYCSILVPYSEDGYKDLVKDLTGEDIEDAAMSSFSDPEESYTFPWAAGQNKLIYVTRFYHREKVKDKVLTLADPFGQSLRVRASSISEIEDELIDEGYEIVGEKEIKRWQITLYIASGSDILETYEIAGENIPVVPQYGERAFVEGEEHYEGVVRLAKDPQRLRNFQLSYLADIVSRSPRPKPIFWSEQLGKFQHMYEEDGSDNNYPYYIQERYDANGVELPGGPIGQMPEQSMPTALIQSIELSREAVGDVAPANVPQDIADVDLSGKAVAALQNRLDEQSMVYQQNRKHALRRDAEIYASMASEILDSPRTVTITKPDGTRDSVQIMEYVQDNETGEMVAVNDLTGKSFKVYADIGTPYASKKQETIEQLGTMAERTAQLDPALSKMLMLEQLTLMDGVNMDNIRDYANKQLVMNGYKEPETEEEMAMLEQAQQNQQPDANMVLAMAEQGKAQAAQMREETSRLKLVTDVQNDQEQTDIDAFKAQTDRANVEVNAAKAGAEINYKNIQAFGAQLDNMAKTSPFRVRVNAG